MIARYLMERGGQLEDYRERDRLLYWYVHTFLWGRYAGSTESVLNRDLGLIEEPDGALDRLIQELRQVRGDLRLQPNDFRGWSRGARFYPLLYMLTRVCQAKDWETGLELSKHLLGHLSVLELHHVFPKRVLYDAGYARSEVNALANFTFLTKETNLRVRDRDPAEYLAEYAQRNPGVVESHWIPMAPELWRVENYGDFLEARRHLLADAANDFLESLVGGGVPETVAASPILERGVPVAIGGVDSEEEEELLRACNDWVVEQGLPPGEYLYELVDPDTGDLLAILDLAWPDGLQSGYSQPVALLIDENSDIEGTVNTAGFRFFTDIDIFRRYVQREILSMDPAAK